MTNTKTEGEWIYNKNICYCSTCKKVAPEYTYVESDEDFDGNVCYDLRSEFLQTAFCPHCGAKMQNVEYYGKKVSE